MQDFIAASNRISKCINDVAVVDVVEACKMLDDYWCTYCEVNVTFLFITWTRHNHAAKGAWARLDHDLRQRIKEIKANHNY